MEQERSWKERENEEALGGMRNPHRSLPRLPGARRYGGSVRSLLNKAVELWPNLIEPAFNILKGREASPMDERVVSAVRNSVLGLLSGSTDCRDRKAKADTPLRAEVIEAWGRCVGDPDSETIADWLDNGAPLGYTQPIPCNGVFPKVEGIEWKAEALQTLARSLSGWQNYMSAVEEAAELEKLVEDYPEHRLLITINKLGTCGIDFADPP